MIQPSANVSKRTPSSTELGSETLLTEGASAGAQRVHGQTLPLAVKDHDTGAMTLPDASVAPLNEAV